MPSIPTARTNPTEKDDGHKSRLISTLDESTGDRTPNVEIPMSTRHIAMTDSTKIKVKDTNEMELKKMTTLKEVCVNEYGK
jgi:hypothetical protein